MAGSTRSIRSQLRRKVAVAYAVAVAGALVTFAGARFMPDDFIPEILVLPGVALFGIGILMLHLRVRCPRCQGNLAATVGTPAPFAKRINYCHYCGIALDERWPPSRQDGAHKS